MKSHYIFVFLLGLSGSINQITAQTCCSGGVPLSSNLGLPNEGKGIIILGVNYDYNNLNSLNAGRDELDDDSRQRITNSVLFNLGYSISNRISVEALLTWVNQSRTISQFGNENFTETSGIGDAVFLLKYSIPDPFGNRTLLNLGTGTKAPLADSDILSENGLQLTADLQPGSGAWDALGWVSVSKGMNFRPSASVSLSYTLRLTGKNNSYLNNTATYEFGDEMILNLGYTDQLLLFSSVIINPGLVLKYRRAFEDKIDDQEIPNTGGEWIFIRPELGLALTQQIHLNSRLELPLYSFVEGTQLTPTARVSFGITYSFNTKKTDLLTTSL